MKTQIIEKAIDVAGRVPPHDANAEKTVISAITLDPMVAEEIMPKLKEEFFYVSAHRTIFKALKSLHDRQQTIDLGTLVSKLTDMGQLEPIGGVLFLSDMISFTATVANPSQVAQRIVDKAKQREMLLELQRCVAEGFSSQDDVPKFIESVQQRVYAVSNDVGNRKTSYELGELAYECNMQLAGLAPPSPPPEPFGLTALDKITSGGHRPGELVIVAGRPGMGKSAHVLGIASHLIQKEVGVAVFSLEMGKDSLFNRIIASMARVPTTVVKLAREGKAVLQPGDADRIMEMLQSFVGKPCRLDEKPGVTLSYIRAECRRFSTKYFPGKKLKTVIVDYIQLMRPDEQIESREQQISSISRGLKELAKEFECSVIACAQLNRESERRTNKRPQLSDLRESGAIEQDADMVLFPFRPQYAQRPEQNIPSNMAEEAEIIVDKQRDGSTGSVPVIYVPRIASYENCQGGN